MADDKKPKQVSGAVANLGAVNDRLKELVASLSADRERRESRGRTAEFSALPPSAGLPPERKQERIALLEAELADRVAELHRVREDLIQLARENQKTLEEVAQAERQHALTSRFFAALASVHASLHRDAVVQSLQEVVANLLGCEDLAILWRDRDGAALPVVLASGETAASLPPVTLGQGAIGLAVRAGRVDVPAATAGAPYAACVPLRIDGEPRGAIVLLKMLPQKPKLTDDDLQLLELLGEHAGLALQASAP